MARNKFFVKRFVVLFILVLTISFSIILSTLVLAASSPWSQTNWAGGSGQTNWSDATMFSSSSSVKTSVAGEITLNPSVDSGWYNSSWGFRKKITFDNSAQAENLSNFPVMVKRASSDTTFWSHVNTNCEDLRFTDSDGTTLLKYEIEKCNHTSDDLIAWVKVPQIDASSATDYIYMYYGNSSATDGQDATNVWSSNTLGQWHLKETTLTDGASLDDSSSNGEDLQIVSGATSATGQIDGGLSFSSPQYLKQKVHDSQQGTVSVTSNTLVDTGQDFSAWETTSGRLDYKVVVTRAKAKLKTKSQSSPTGTITGASSGATATIDYAASSLGYLEVSNVSGTFLPGETVNGTSGSAVLRDAYLYVPNSINLPAQGDTLTGLSSNATGVVVSAATESANYKVTYRRTSATKFTLNEQVTVAGSVSGTVTSSETTHQDNPLMDLRAAGYIGDVTTNNTAPLLTLPASGASGWAATGPSQNRRFYINDDYPRGTANPAITYDVYKADFDRQDNLTYSLWLKTSTGNKIITKSFWDDHDNVGGGYGIGTFYTSGSNPPANTSMKVIHPGGSTTKTIAVSSSSWHLVNLVYENNNSLSIYLDGSLVSGGTATYTTQNISDNISDTSIILSNLRCKSGEDYCVPDSYTYQYDQFEITTDVWSANWIAAKYKSESDTLNTFASEEQQYPVGSGTLTSSIFDTEQNSNWGTLTYTSTAPTNTSVTVQVRSSANADMSSATAYCTVASGVSMSSCATNTHRYLQYKVTLSTTNGASSPTFSDISLAFSQSVADSSPPTTTNNIDASWHNSNVTVTLTCNDGSGNGCANTYYTTDGTTPTVSSSSGSGATTTFTLSSDGTYTIKYFSVDNNGNTESVKTATNTVKIDKTVPAIPGTPTTTSVTNDTTPTWTWTASDGSLSGLATTAYTVQWSTDSTFATVAGSSTSTTNSFTHTSPLADGTWYFRVKATDAAGNDSSYSSSGSYWQGNGLELTTAASIAIDPSDSNRVYFGYWDQGFLKSLDGGSKFKMTNASVYGTDSNGNYPSTRSDGGNVFSIVVDPDRRNVIYASNNMWKTNDGLISKSTDYGETWTTMGGGSQEVNNLPNGQIWSIALDINSDPNSRTIYVASKDNGIYKSTDGGSTWTASFDATTPNIGLDTISQSSRAMAVAVSQSNSQIVYAGFKGVRNSGTPDTTPSDLGGVYKSTDGGTNWTKVGSSSIGSVNGITIDPTDPNIVYAAAGFIYDPGIEGNANHPQWEEYAGGVYKTTDGGTTWTRILTSATVGLTEDSENATAVVINPSTPTTIYASFSNTQSFDEYRSAGVWKSTNSGTSWSAVNTGLTMLNIDTLAIDPSSPTTLYAGSRGTGAFKGTDSGGSVTWTSIGPGGGGYMPVIKVIPTANNSSRIIYAGGNVSGFLKSTDNGQTFQVLNSGLKNYDVEDIVYDPNTPTTIYLATPGGVYKSTDGGSTWVDKRNGFPSTSIWAFTKPVLSLAMDPNDSNTLYAGIGRLFEDSVTTAYGVGQIWKTTDGAATWSQVNTGGNAIASSATILKIAIKSDSSAIYAATDKGLYKSTDGGVNWSTANANLPSYQGASVPYVRNIVIDPTDASTLYSVLYTKPNTSSPSKYPWLGGVYKSTNNGGTWAAMTNGLAPDNAEINRTTNDYRTTRNYWQLVINPQNNQELFLGSTAYWGAGVWKSSDGGGAWTALMDSPPTNIDIYPTSRFLGGTGVPAIESLAIDTTTPSVLFYSQQGVMRSSDSGANWSQKQTTATLASVTIDSTAPTVSAVTAAPTATGATITWTTSENSSSQVNYGLSTAYRSSTIEADTSTRVQSHSVTLSGLVSCTKYHYRVRSTDTATNEVVGSDNTFTTTGCTGSATVDSQTNSSITIASGGSVSLLSGSTGLALTIPPSFAGNDANFQIKQLDKTLVLNTTSTPVGYSAIGSYVYDLKALSDSTTAISSFDNSLTVSINYSSADVLGTDASTLRIWRWDGSSWNMLSGCSVDTSTKTVTCSTQNFSVFALFGLPSSSSSSSTSSSSSSTSSSGPPVCGDSPPGARTPWLYGAIPQDSSSVMLYFTDADDPVTSYALEYGTTAGNYRYSAVNIGGKGMRTYLVKSLSPSTTYYFRVRGQNGCQPGAWSSEISAKTKPSVSFKSLEITSSELMAVPKFTGTTQQETQKETEKEAQEDSKTSQDGYFVRVKVTDHDKPIQGAKVTIHSAVQTAITNEEGIAEFNNVERGEHKVIIDYNNYQGEQSISLTGDVKEFNLNISIKQQNVLLSPVVMVIMGVMAIIIVVLAVFLVRMRKKK